MAPVPDAAEPFGSPHSTPSAESWAESVPPAEAAPVRYLTLATTLVGALVLLAADAAGQGALLAVTLALSLVLAWAWPAISGTATPRDTTVVLALSAVAIVLSALRDDLQWVAAAAAAGILLSFLAQLRRTTGREGLVVSLFSAFGGLVLIASGATAVVAGGSDRGRHIVAVAMAAVVTALVADLLGRAARRPSLFGPVAVLLGVCAAAGVTFAWPATGAAPAVVGVSVGVSIVVPVVVGATVGAISWAFRRVLMLQPGIGTRRGQIGAGVGSLLAVGAVVHLASVIT